MNLTQSISDMPQIIKNPPEPNGSSGGSAREGCSVLLKKCIQLFRGTSGYSQQKEWRYSVCFGRVHQHRPAFHIRSVQMSTERNMRCESVFFANIFTAPFVWYGFIIARVPLFVQCKKYIAAYRFRLLRSKKSL